MAIPLQHIAIQIKWLEIYLSEDEGQPKILLRRMVIRTDELNPTNAPSKVFFGLTDDKGVRPSIYT